MKKLLTLILGVVSWAAFGQTAIPHSNDFSTYPGTGWSEMSASRGNPCTVVSATTGSWGADGFANVGFTGAARINIWTSTQDDWLLSPALTTTAGSNYLVSFDAALTPYALTSSGAFDTDDTIFVVVSYDGGTTWNISDAVLKIHQGNQPGNTATAFSAVFTATGASTKLGWAAYSTTSTADVDFFIDNVSITAATTLPCTAPFFSEYTEGGTGYGNDKALEIYNPNSTPLNVTGYSVSNFANGNTTAAGTYTFPAGTTIPANGVYVIAASGANAPIADNADTMLVFGTGSPVHFNGDDAVVLFNASGDTLDIIGVVGVDPGTEWPVGSGSTKDYTLIRKHAVQLGETDWAVGATQWNVFAFTDHSNLGVHYGVCGGGPVSNCPISEVPVVDTVYTCGTSNVTFSYTPTTSNATTLWFDSSNRPIGKGNTFTTANPFGVDSTFGAAVYADNNYAAGQHLGNMVTGALGFGNFTNGMFFEVSSPMSLDSITVVSNGLVDFQVRIWDAVGSKIALPPSGDPSKLLMTSDMINVATADTHQVHVGLVLTPGLYFMNMKFATGTPGQLWRSTSGAVYPYTISGVVSLDSVQLATQNRVYYAFDWVVSEGCMGTITPAQAMAAPQPTYTLPYTEPFTGELPCTWDEASSGAHWTWTDNHVGSTWFSVGSFTGSSTGSTGFLVVDDDALGNGAGTYTTAVLTSPIFSDATGYDTLQLDYDVYLKYDDLFVEVFDGTSWVGVDTLSGTTGSPTAAVHRTIDLAPYQNGQMQIRFTYDDGGIWGYGAALDNIAITGTLLPCTPVRFELLTDQYGSEISWSIVDINTGGVMATGGPYPDVIATYVDTVCLPDNGTYEVRIVDSFGDGLTDGNVAGYYKLDVLCPWGDNRILTIDTTLVSPYNPATWGPFPYGGPVPTPMYDSAVFTTSCVQYTNVTFQVDMNKVTQGFTTPEVNGTWNNWCGSCNAMSDANGDNIWEVTLPLEQGTTVEFKYSADGWSIQEMNDPTASCTNGNATYTNRVLTIPASDTIIPVVCWSSCDACSIEVTLNVNMAWEVANGAVSTDGIHVAGSFQGWSPSTTEMTDPDGDGIYSVTLEMPLSQDLFYKFINGNDWAVAEASGDLAACGVSDGFGGYNRHSVTANADTNFAAVCFTKCYDCAVSIDEALGTINLFPNPTTGAFTMERSELAGNIEVTVIGLQGQLLLATEWTAGQSELNIDLSDLAAGVYMVRLTAEEGTRTLRVAVQR
jgi:hypothetical protein